MPMRARVLSTPLCRLPRRFDGYEQGAGKALRSGKGNNGARLMNGCCPRLGWVDAR